MQLIVGGLFALITGFSNVMMGSDPVTIVVHSFIAFVGGIVVIDFLVWLVHERGSKQEAKVEAEESLFLVESHSTSVEEDIAA